MPKPEVTIEIFDAYIADALADELSTEDMGWRDFAEMLREGGSTGEIRVTRHDREAS